MESENLIIDDGRQRQKVEQIGVVAPDVGVAIFSEAFVIETVYWESTVIVEVVLATIPCVICLDSWLPRRMVTRWGYRTLSATRRVTVSTE